MTHTGQGIVSKGSAVTCDYGVYLQSVKGQTLGMTSLGVLCPHARHPSLVENLNTILPLHYHHGHPVLFHVVQNSLQATQHSPQSLLSQRDLVTVILFQI